MKKNFLSVLVVTVFMLSVFFACKNSSNNSDNDNKQNTQIDSIKESAELSTAKKIFYSLPAPHEVASILIDHPSATYLGEILNPTSKAESYNTTTIKAFNIGVYGTDLSYASLFEQNQTVIDYMAKSKKLAEDIGILQVFTEDKINQLETSVNNKDEIINIISETFLDSDAYLTENNRHNVAAMILIGGWIEGMYIALNLTEKSTTKNKDLTNSILDQYHSIPLIIGYLDEYKENKDLEEITKDINNIYNVYEQSNIEESENGDYKITEENFLKIYDLIVNIRNKYTK